MDSHQFTEFLKKWKAIDQLPTYDMWPKQINVNSQVRDQIKTLYKYTDSNNHEYESMLFFEGNNPYLSKPYKGDKSSVSVGHQIRASYKPVDKYYYQKTVTIDNYDVAKEKVKVQDVPKEIKVGSLFNIHSHPYHLDQNGSKYYSFFSSVDLNTLLASRNPVLGMVSNQIWLACKSRESLNISNLTIQSIFDKMNKEGIFRDNDPRIVELIRNEWKRAGIVFYKGGLGSLLSKV